MNPCCAATRVRATAGSANGIVKLPGGPFPMGIDIAEGFPADGEGPIRDGQPA